ncbi:MAG: 4-hydroxythreonine-4-phosphate dehydrogenase PdxA, partial [Alphaproteobacteria bacterium]
MTARAAARPLALTMGEPAGIGGEIALKAWRALKDEVSAPAFFIIDDPERLARLSAELGLGVPVRAIATPAEAGEAFPAALPVLPRRLDTAVVPGQPKAQTAAATIAAIEGAVELVLSGQAAAVVTNPIHKKTLYQSGFAFPGHTEFLGQLAARHTGQPAAPVMMLVAGSLRVVPVTVHIPLRDVPAALTAAGIVHCGRIAAQSLSRDFGIERPRLAVCGLNPHAGEDGALGTEEAAIIAPAVAELRAQGVGVSGPLPADSLFHEAARARYDAVLCMYHDQALIPLKTVDFEHGVNVTLGLPFVRTSPDHGTAFDIAGQGRAHEAS